ncbi:cytochrome P450 monooxygenase-like protein [Amniculicola lignicola CBS 123094]|uniref:Cytochrome P450 monooxygenase-like protein n=1 Tax=Amniculicola lignicola CBS 123094 TaxID=1392246 RepID=A0A6A5X094_9PLEO|nr:cytochrome P450 monooxygenase-like protein [Amniculicola lignicola CBS 123094]
MVLSTSGQTSDFHLFSSVGIVFSVGLLFTSIALYALGTGIYNIFFHPLRHLPGPFLARASGFPYTFRMRDGTIIPWIQELHAKYGDVVRVNPYEVSFISGETAWEDIYGFRTGKQKNTGSFMKDRSWFPTPINGVYSIIVADDVTHSRMRRNLAHAFSDKALKAQEGMVQQYADLLCHRLQEQKSEGVEAVDITRWYNYTTFDVITDLTFGEPLYCLRDNEYHPWVHMVFAAVMSIGLLASRKRFPLFTYYDNLKGFFTDSSKTYRERAKFFALVQAKVADRLEKDTDRPDFFHHVIKNMESSEKALTTGEMESNAVVLMVAGSETTATLLSGVTYLLLKHPKIYAKVVHEVRSKFQKRNDITFEEASKLEYMIACLSEALRYYPPVPTGFARSAPHPGGMVSGHFIPENTSVYVSQHATNHSPRNYTDPDSFVPERWLGDVRYKDDNRAATQPFSFGPRNCLGKNLAYSEMRVILAKVLFTFDLELANKEQDWIAEHKCFTLWKKPDLMIKLHPVQR